MAQQLANKSKVDWRVINWLRGLAALYVVVNHSRGFLFSDATAYAEHINPKEQWAWWEWMQMLMMQFTNTGTEFVIFFFLLSGFSIAHSLKDTTDVPGFYKRRFVRLYPTFLVGIIWAIVPYLAMRAFVPEVYYQGVEGHIPMLSYFDRFFLDAKTLLANLFYIPMNNYMTPQYWSLPYEVIFYLVAPWMIRRMKMFGIITVVGFTIGWVLLGRTTNHIGNENMLLTFFTDYTIYFFAGILFYKYKDLLIQKFPLGKKTFIVTALGLFVTMALVKGYVFGQHHNKITGFISMALAYVLLFGSLKHAIRINWLEKIGEYSYTLYVTHVASIFLVKVAAQKMGMGFFFIDNLFLWYAGILVSVGFGYVLYHMGEKQSTKYLGKLRTAQPRSATLSDVPASISLGMNMNKPATAKYEPLADENSKVLH